MELPPHHANTQSRAKPCFPEPSPRSPNTSPNPIRSFWLSLVSHLGLATSLLGPKAKWKCRSLVKKLLRVSRWQQQRLSQVQDMWPGQLNMALCLQVMCPPGQPWSTSRSHGCISGRCLPAGVFLVVFGWRVFMKISFQSFIYTYLLLM